VQLNPQYLAEVIEALKKMESSAAGSDKRRFSRIAVVTRLEVLEPSTGRTYAALTRDFSIEGIGLIQSTAMAKGAVMAISLPRGKHGSLVAHCEVAHARELADGVWGVGAVFKSVTLVAPAPTKNESAEAGRIKSRMLG
jgi:hypothetical protein